MSHTKIVLIVALVLQTALTAGLGWLAFSPREAVPDPATVDLMNQTLHGTMAVSNYQYTFSLEGRAKEKRRYDDSFAKATDDLARMEKKFASDQKKAEAVQVLKRGITAQNKVIRKLQDIADEDNPMGNMHILMAGLHRLNEISNVLLPQFDFLLDPEEPRKPVELYALFAGGILSMAATAFAVAKAS